MRIRLRSEVILKDAMIIRAANPTNTANIAENVAKNPTTRLHMSFVLLCSKFLLLSLQVQTISAMIEITISTMYDINAIRKNKPVGIKAI